MRTYAELHCHSAFSLLDGASTPEVLVGRAVELGIPALALTDHDDMGGVVRFSRAAREAGLEAIVGVELTVASPLETLSPPSHLTLLARTAEGYANLCELISRGRMGEGPACPTRLTVQEEWAPNRGLPRVTWDDVAELSGGLLALSGCSQGELARRVRSGNGIGAREFLDFLREVFPGCLAVEVWDHALPEERALADRLLELADEQGLPAVATNDVHYAKPSGRIVHDVLTCLRHRVTLDEAGTRLRPNGEWHLKPPSVVWRRWRHRPDVVENTLIFAAACSFRLTDLSPAMPGFRVPTGVTRQEFLEKLVWRGALERYGGSGRLRNGDPIRVADPAGNGMSAARGSFRFMSRGTVPTEEVGPPRSKLRSTTPAPPPGSATRSGNAILPESPPAAPPTTQKEGARAERAAVSPAASSNGSRDRVRSEAVDESRADALPQKGGRARAHERTADRAKEGATETHERTFGARWPVGNHGPQSRDMKRGVSVAPDGPRDMKRGVPVAPDENRGLTQRVRRQIRHELEVIGRLDLAGYFLTVWDIVRFARRRGILLQGRGSAANSCVCYCLGITAVDPIKFELLFERFLSEERGGAPDIDLDIEHERREEVLQYVYAKYGRERAAMVCEAITYRGRSAVRDAARVLGFSTDVADRLADEADRHEAAGAADALENGGLAACGLDPANRRVRALVHVVRGLDQLPRHRSIHVGGFVLTQGPLSRVVPIEPAAMRDRTVIQWDKDDLELTGLIKIDLLGLGMLTCLAKAIRYIRETRGVAIDLARLPADDPEVYGMIQAADTVGLFQIESRAQMNSLPRLRPENFYDLVVQVAIIRPGPIQGDMVHPYIRRRRGEEPVTYLHPDLEPILHRTLGVPLFQEQGMKVAVAMAGFTPGQADVLRRAMGFKRSREAMAAIEPALREGMTKRGVTPEVQDYIVKYLTAFANYGFPESHAASFALLVYASAYLRRYYAPEYCCALLNAQPMGFYAPGTLVHDARRHGVEVRPVDLAYSSWDCTLESNIVVGARVGAAGDPSLHVARDRAGMQDGPGRSKCPLVDPPPRPVSRDRGSSRLPTAPKSHGSTDPQAGTAQRDERYGGCLDGTPDRAKEGGTGTHEHTTDREKEGGTGAHERTFGARWPVGDGSPKSRDMKRGVPVPPDCSRDMKRGVSVAPDAPALRIGLRYIRGLGSKAEEQLKAAWESGGPFTSVEDVVRRSRLGLPALKTLAEAGAFDTLWGPGRRSALWEVLARLADKPLAPVDGEAGAASKRRHSKLKEMSPVELIAADYMTTGLCTHGHPMEFLREQLHAAGVLSAEELTRTKSGQRVRVAGVVICRQRPGTAKGVCFVTLEDETGFSNFVIYADTFERYRRTIVRSPVLLIEGTAQNEQGVINVQARHIEAIVPRAGAEVIESHDFH